VCVVSWIVLCSALRLSPLYSLSLFLPFSYFLPNSLPSLLLSSLLSFSLSYSSLSFPFSLLLSSLPSVSSYLLSLIPLLYRTDSSPDPI
jgi:hypothetical protein